MRVRRKTLTITAVVCVALTSAAIGYAFANPGVAACAVVDFAPFAGLADGVLIDARASQQDRAAAMELLSDARSRVKQTFGAPRANPIVVFFDAARTFGPLKVNEYGSTSFIGSRACVMVGPKGRNPDVMAHELVHAELFDRVGAWARLTQIPVWFDEGLAMQVDYREKYNLPGNSENDAKKVRLLEKSSDFWRGDDAVITGNYAMAKAEVAQWLAEVGKDSVYRRLERIGAGEAFADVISPPTP
jgi:hypothetical protein